MKTFTNKLIIIYSNAVSYVLKIQNFLSRNEFSFSFCKDQKPSGVMNDYVTSVSGTVAKRQDGCVVPLKTQKGCIFNFLNLTLLFMG